MQPDLAALEYFQFEDEYSDSPETWFFNTDAEFSFFRVSEMLGMELPKILPETFRRKEYEKLNKHEMVSSAMFICLQNRNYLSKVSALSRYSRISLKQAAAKIDKLGKYNINHSDVKIKINSDRVLKKEDLRYFSNESVLESYDFERYDFDDDFLKVFIPKELHLSFYLKACELYNLTALQLVKSLNWLQELSISTIDETSLSQSIKTIKDAGAEFYYSDRYRLTSNRFRNGFFWPISLESFQKLNEGQKCSKVLQFVGHTNLNFEESISLFQKLEEIVWNISMKDSATNLLPNKPSIKITEEHRHVLRSVNDMNIQKHIVKKRDPSFLKELKTLGIVVN